MGTSKGNIGRKMYIDETWRKNVSAGNTLKRVTLDKQCKKCLSSFSVIRTVSKTGNINSPKYEKVFCSKKCSNSHSVSDITKKKISKSLCKIREERKCVVCDSFFLLYKRQHTCSKKCQRIYRRSMYLNTLDVYKRYRVECIFRFSLNDYPDSFDFSLIDKYGWYKAVNNGNNPNGISRDHMMSIRYGFDNNIPAEYIRHPANCQLLRQSVNVSKGKKTSITLDELLKRIEQWPIVI